MAEATNERGKLHDDNKTENNTVDSVENPLSCGKVDPVKNHVSAGSSEVGGNLQDPGSERGNANSVGESRRLDDDGTGGNPAKIAAQTGEEIFQESSNFSIKEEERAILSEFSASLSLEEQQNQKLTLERHNQTMNSDLADSLSPPYSILESSGQTSPASSVVTDSSPNEPQDNDGFENASQVMAMQQQRSGAVAILSNVEATGTSGSVDSMGDGTTKSQTSFDHGTVMKEGEMVSFVADDLMTKIRQSTSSASTSPANSNRDISPTTASISSSSSRFSMRSSSIGSSSAIPPIDPTAVADLEKQCKHVADSLDLMFGHLAGTLHNMSAITVGHTQTYRDAVEKAGVTADHCVRSMYALMAKCEELQNSMQATKDLSDQIKNIKRQLDELELLCK